MIYQNQNKDKDEDEEEGKDKDKDERTVMQALPLKVFWRTDDREIACFQTCSQFP